MSISGKNLRRVIIVAGVIGVEVAVLYARSNSAKKLKAKAKDPTIAQYLNRLVEFFDYDIIDRAMDEFLTMVDFGVYPHEAFSILTFSGELN